MTRRSTRERILTTCLALLNARGPMAVTTAEIARATGINEGNLYYYFKKKADIVSVLFDRFAAEQLTMAEQGYELREWFRLMWEWRFFYRDSAAIFTLAPDLRLRLQELSDQVQDYHRETLREMVRAGRLNASDKDIERLLVNAWIVSTYWIEYLHSRHGVTRLTPDHLAWGYEQMESLFRPYLVGHARIARPAPAADGLGAR